MPLPGWPIHWGGSAFRSRPAKSFSPARNRRWCRSLRATISIAVSAAWAVARCASFEEREPVKLDQATIAKLAEHLENAELRARDVTKITDDYPDIDWDDAYAIQYEIR